MEALEAQLGEIEVLRSMFPGKGEVSADEAVEMAASYLENGGRGDPPPPLRISVALDLGATGKAELSAELPPAYPDARPHLLLRADSLSRERIGDLNRELTRYANSLEPGDPCLYSAICWLKDRFDTIDTIDPTGKGPAEEKQPEPEPEAYARLWIYSHHIYNTNKRKEILSTADEFRLTGFMLSGKPGIVCVEGEASECDEWWSRIKLMNWKKILIRKKEDFSSGEEFQRKFPDFREVSFQPQNNRGNDKHSDMGEFYKFLNDHNSSYVFVDYFGVDGRAT